MKKWQYSIVRIPRNEDLLQRFNEQGEKGWDYGGLALDHDGESVLIFKKPLVDDDMEEYDEDGEEFDND